MISTCTPYLPRQKNEKTGMKITKNSCLLFYLLFWKRRGKPSLFHGIFGRAGGGQEEWASVYLGLGKNISAALGLCRQRLRRRGKHEAAAHGRQGR